jgi:hypothetical protein
MYRNANTQRCHHPSSLSKIFYNEKAYSEHPQQQIKQKRATGVNDTRGAPWGADISENFRKKSKRPLWYTQGLGENWFMKKPEVENLVALFL